MSRQCCQGREGDITMAKLGHSASLSGSFELLPNVLVDADHQTKYRQNHHRHHHHFFFVTTNTIKTVNMLMTCVCFWVCVKTNSRAGRILPHCHNRHIHHHHHDQHHFDLWRFCGFWLEQVPQRAEADREGGNLVAARRDIAAIIVSVSNYNEIINEKRTCIL